MLDNLITKPIKSNEEVKYGQFVKLAALQDAARAPPLAPRAVRHVATITGLMNEGDNEVLASRQRLFWAGGWSARAPAQSNAALSTAPVQLTLLSRLTFTFSLKT
ncbi:hypothetical protein RR46_06094 [Papilio xuthus]|uniref:Uncharacterized protein n=1 Tax=Papilio xuthus TaxID=66420 RepID=A0A194Q8E5_PAPXU|nr:hypothetical protein RR46_06094 [Papilio xuthus]